MNVELTPEHVWLQKLVGEWVQDNDGAENGTNWVESVRSLNGTWVVAEGHGEMPENGGPATTMMTLGYDLQKKRVVGTWIGSMMSNLWIYDGELDAEGKKLTLDSEGPSFTDDGTIGKYKDVIDFVSDDERTLTSLTQEADGSWKQFMVATYRRKK
jgi:hypothetical protein